MKTFLSILTCLLLIPNQSFSQDSSCKELVSYRDTDLIKIWKEKQDKYRISKDAVLDIQNLKTNLLSDTNYANSDIQPILLIIKTLANTIEDAVGMASPQGKLINLAKQSGEVTVKSEKVYKLIESGKSNLEAAMSEDVEKTIAKQALLDLAGARSGLAFFVNLHDNLRSFQDFSDMRGEIKIQLSQIENSLERYNQALEKPYSAFREINNYKNYIDIYLKENCKIEKKETYEIGSPDSSAQMGFLVGIAHSSGFTGNSYCQKSILAVNQEVRFTKQEYAEIVADLTKVIRQKYPSPKYQFPTKTVVLPNQSVIIYSFKVEKSDCQDFVISYSKAKSIDEAQKEIERRMNTCENCHSYTEIERWPRPRTND